MNFFRYYDKWLNECKEDLRKKGYKEEDVEQFVICEDGRIYYGYFIITEPGFVTPWKKSKHFIDWGFV